MVGAAFWGWGRFCFWPAPLCSADAAPACSRSTRCAPGAHPLLWFHLKSIRLISFESCPWWEWKCGWKLWKIWRFRPRTHTWTEPMLMQMPPEQCAPAHGSLQAHHAHCYQPESDTKNWGRSISFQHISQRGRKGRKKTDAFYKLWENGFYQQRKLLKWTEFEQRPQCFQPWGRKCHEAGFRSTP